MIQLKMVSVGHGFASRMSVGAGGIIGLKRRLRLRRPGIFPLLARALYQDEHPNDSQNDSKHYGAEHKPRPFVPWPIVRLILLMHAIEIICDSKP